MAHGQIREGGGLIVVFDTPFLAILAIVSRIRMNHTCYNYRWRPEILFYMHRKRYGHWLHSDDEFGHFLVQ